MYINIYQVYYLINAKIVCSLLVNVGKILYVTPDKWSLLKKKKI